MLITLYHTLGCHLCELAEDILEDLRRDGLPIEVQPVDIADDEALMAQYGVQIPVLLNPQTNQTLNWPFAKAQVSDWLSGADSAR